MAPEHAMRERRVRTKLPTANATPVFGKTAQRLYVLIAAFALLGQTAFLVSTPAASGYEPSVFTAYPLEFWFVFGAGFVAIVFALIGSAITTSGYWKHAFALLTTQYGFVFALPIIRGYHLYGRGKSDSLFHIAAIYNLAYKGILSGEVFYPHEHMLLSELVIVGVPVEALVGLVPFVFAILFIGGVGLFVREFTGSPAGLPLGIVAASPLLFGKFYTQLHPSVMSFMLFPLILLMLERSRRTNSRRYIALMAAYAFAIILFHPVTTIFLVVLLLSTVVFGYVFGFLTRTEARTLRPTLALAILPALFIWYIGFGRTQDSIRRIIEADEGSAAEQQADLVGESVLSTQEVLVRVINLYGAVVLYAVVAGLFAAIILWALLRRRGAYTEGYAATQFVIGFGLAGTFLAMYLVATGPIRVSRYMILMSMVLIALLFMRVLRAPRYQRAVGVTVLAVVVITAALLGTFTVYTHSKHMTDREFEGTGFMIEYHDVDVPVRGFSTSVKTQRYVVASTGIEIEKEVMRSEPVEKFGVTPHLGYDTYPRASMSYGHSYLVTQEYDRHYLDSPFFTEAQREQLFQHDEATIDRMRYDFSVNRIYSNGGYEGWYVRFGEDPVPLNPETTIDPGITATTGLQTESTTGGSEASATGGNETATGNETTTGNATVSGNASASSAGNTTSTGNETASGNESTAA